MLTAVEPSTRHRATLLSLPNELIQLILDLFPLRSLLPLTLVCHRIHDIIARLIHYRLNALVSAIEPDNIFLECYHPVCKPIGPYLKCAYVHTDILTNGARTRRNDITQNDWHHRQFHWPKFSSFGYLGRLKDSYTHFHPLCHAGPWINTNMHMAPPPRYNIPMDPLNSEQSDSMLIRGSIFLDENELFSQLITGVWLRGQNRQIRLLDGVLRLWRQWLGDMDRIGNFAVRMASRNPAKDHRRGGGGGGGASRYTWKVGSENSDGESPVYPLEDHSIIWLGEKQAGLKFRACQQRRTEGLSFADDSGSDEADENGNDDGNNPVCYDVEIEELLVRTTALLLAADKGFWIQ